MPFIFIKFEKPEQPIVHPILILFLFLPYYNSSPVTNINWITIWLSFLFGVLITILFRFLNKNSKKIDQRSDAGLPLSGWIVVLGITLMIRLVMQGYSFWNENYFLKSTWILLGHEGGAKLHSLFIIEMFLSLLSIAGSGALLYWFFGRRDIFPTMFIYYAGFFLAAQFILLIIYNVLTLPVDLTTVRHEILIQFLRMMVYAVVWVSFVLKSEQVKQTFVYPAG